MKNNLPSGQFLTVLNHQQEKKIWASPQIIAIDILSGNTPAGTEGVHTIIYNGVTFTGIYHS